MMMKKKKVLLTKCKDLFNNSQNENGKNDKIQIKRMNIRVIKNVGI